MAADYAVFCILFNFGFTPEKVHAKPSFDKSVRLKILNKKFDSRNPSRIHAKVMIHTVSENNRNVSKFLWRIPRGQSHVRRLSTDTGSGSGLKKKVSSVYVGKFRHKLGK